MSTLSTTNRWARSYLRRRASKFASNLKSVRLTLRRDNYRANRWNSATILQNELPESQSPFDAKINIGHTSTTFSSTANLRIGESTRRSAHPLPAWSYFKVRNYISSKPYGSLRLDGFPGCLAYTWLCDIQLRVSHSASGAVENNADYAVSSRFEAIR